MAGKSVTQPVVVAPQAKKAKDNLLPMSATMESALLQLNEKVCYIYEGSKIADLSRIENYKIPLIDCSTFKYESHADLVIGRLSVAQEWMRWRPRRVANRRVYVPNADRFTPDGNLNLWFPSTSKPKKGDISLFHEYLIGMMENDPLYLDWVTAWIAYHIQYPNKKMLTGVMFWSHEQGNGKSTLGWLLRQIHGEHNSFLIRTKFPDRFNSYAENMLFGWIDELAPIKKAGQSDDVKSMITQPRILIENKQQRAYEMDDLISYYFTSNYPNALDLTPDDRRFFVHNVGKTTLTRPWFEGTFRPWLERQSSIDAIHHYFLHEVDLIKPIVGGNPESLIPAPFDPVKIAPRNSSRIQAIRDNRDDVEAWLWELKENPEAIIPDTPKRTIFTSEELFKLYRELTGDTKVGLQAFRLRMSGAFVKLCNGDSLRLEDGTRPRLYSSDAEKIKLQPSQVKLCLSQELSGDV